MGRIFLTLYISLALSLGGFIFAVQVLPKMLLHKTTQSYYNRVMSGTFELIEKRLQNLPVAEWQTVIDELQPHFGYPLSIRKVADHDFSSQDLSPLNAHQIVFEQHDQQAIFLYKRLFDTDQYLSLAMGQTRTEDSLRSAKGTAHLISEWLLNRPQSMWPQAIAELQPHFGIPLAIVPIDQPDLTAEKREELRAGKLLIFDIDQTTEHYLMRAGDSAYAVKAGPIGIPFLLDAFSYILIGLLALLVALVVYFWVRPIWRDLKQLDSRAHAFGKGEFSSRLSVSRRSAIHHLAGTFNSMADRIQRLIRSHRDLTNAVSHELRTPISRLHFGLEMLEQHKDQETRSRHLAGMREDLAELEQLVSELLDHARLDRDGPGFQFEQQLIAPWLRKHITRFESQDGVVIHCNIAGGIEQESCTFDERQLARAFDNLLRNAQRYARSEIQITLSHSSNLWQLAVEDDGPGVSAADRERILQPFVRLDESRDRRSGGTGLGLAIVHRIMVRHQGALIVEESNLDGACFTLRWPDS